MSEMQQQRVLPMLAHTLDGAHRKHLHFPCITQPKLDGVRMLVSMRGSGMYSRTGKPFDHLVPLFATQLRTLIPPSSSSLVLDGELYVHRAGFQKIVSMAKNASDMAAASKELQYWIYDVYDPARPNLTTSARMELLEALFASVGDRDRDKQISKLRLVPTKMCAKESEIASILDRHEKAGYEGVMLRNLDAPYAPGKRSNGLLKLKSFMDGEFEIVGFEEAGGKDKGTVVFVCSSSSKGGRGSVEFRVRPTGTFEERSKMLQDAHKLIGKMLTVRYQELSRDGVPRFPVGIAIRDYE